MADMPLQPLLPTHVPATTCNPQSSTIIHIHPAIPRLCLPCRSRSPTTCPHPATAQPLPAIPAPPPTPPTPHPPPLPTPPPRHPTCTPTFPAALPLPPTATPPHLPCLCVDSGRERQACTAPFVPQHAAACTGMPFCMVLPSFCHYWVLQNAYSSFIIFIKTAFFSAFLVLSSCSINSSGLLLIMYSKIGGGRHAAYWGAKAFRTRVRLLRFAAPLHAQRRAWMQQRACRCWRT